MHSKEERRKKIISMLHKVDLGGEYLAKKPNQLSGGEQQRVAIARALVNEPIILLADEITGNLDPVSENEIILLLEKINSKGTAILMATHDYKHMGKYGNRTLTCEDGRVLDSKNAATASTYQAPED